MFKAIRSIGLWNCFKSFFQAAGRWLSGDTNGLGFRGYWALCMTMNKINDIIKDFTKGNVYDENH